MKWLIVALLLVVADVAAVEDQLVEVTATRLNVRAAPSAQAPVIGQVGKGDQLIVVPTSGRWAATSYSGETVGFLSTRHLRVLKQRSKPKPVSNANAPEPRDEALATAAIWVVSLLAAAAFLVVVFRPKSVKRHARDKRSTPSDQGTAVTTTGPDESQANTPGVRREPKIGYPSAVLNEPKERGGIQDLQMARVEYVIDGDTVIVSNAWKKTRIRLSAIDCPEDGQPWGDIATAGLVKMIGGRSVRIEEHGEDHYGRLIATIYVQQGRESNWVDVNEKMVVKGHAWVMRKYYGHLPKERQDKLNRLERWARTRKVGLWNTPRPIPPWRWRSRDLGRGLQV